MLSLPLPWGAILPLYGAEVTSAERERKPHAETAPNMGFQTAACI